MIHVIFVHWEAFNTCVFNGVMEESEPVSRFICGALFVLWLIPDSLSFRTWGSHFRRQRLMNGISTGCCRKWLCVTQQRQQLYLSCSTNWKMTDLPDSRKKRQNYKLNIFAFGEEPTTVHIFYTSTLENTPKETLNKSTMILINESDSLLFLPLKSVYLIIKVKTVKTWWISFSTSTLKIPLISLSPIKFSELFKKYQISCRELGCHLSFRFDFFFLKLQRFVQSYFHQDWFKRHERHLQIGHVLTGNKWLLLRNKSWIECCGSSYPEPFIPCS